MLALRLALAAPFLLAASPVASADAPVDPLRFFEGRTETRGTTKVVFRKPYKTHSIGVGRLQPDGSLALVQQVMDEDKPPHERRWRVRRGAAPGRFTATMSEAVGPVAIDRVGERYRFRFKMKGDLLVEQLLTPLPGGRAARNSLKVKRMGVTVATSEGLIRKV